MASDLTLNTTNGAIKLVPQDGSGTQTLNIGRQPNLGKVLGIAYGYPPVRTATNAWFSTSSQSAQNTGLSVTYTPKSLTSKLFISYSVGIHVQSSANQGIQLWIYRDGSNITTGYGGNAQASSFYHDASHTRDFYNVITNSWIVNSVSTNSTTFTLMAGSWITDSTIHLGVHDGQSIITVWEIEN